MEVLYFISLTVIILTAVVVALHSAIPGGWIGSTMLGGVAIFAMAGFDQSPPNWLVGFMTALAGVCVWAAARWQFARSRLLRRLRDL